MKNILRRLDFPLLVLMSLAFFATEALAVNSPVEKDKDMISYSQMFDTEEQAVKLIDGHLDKIEAILDKTRMTYDQLVDKYPELTERASLEESEIVNSLAASDAPAGINGFFWGFCLWVLGILIVLLVMEEGPARSKHLKNALWGCIASAGLYVLLWLIFVVLIGTGSGLWWWYG